MRTHHSNERWMDELESELVDVMLALRGLVALLSVDSIAASGYQIAALISSLSEKLDRAFERLQEAK